jgi:sugar/nucleoside kinase (ribokinase family)
MSSTIHKNELDRYTQNAIRHLKISSTKKSQTRVLAWLDGAIDEIIHVVSRRISPNDFIRLKLITDLTKFVKQSEGKSSNLELFTQQIKYGGNAPIFAGAIAKLNHPTTLVALLGEKGKIHDVFKPLSSICRLLTVGIPGHTDALEFDDGKIMLGKHAPYHGLSWQRITQHISPNTLIGLINECKLFAQSNWVMFSHMNEIWQNLTREILPNLIRKPRVMLVDLADPKKRPINQLQKALELITGFEDYFQVYLSLNTSEALQVAQALGKKITKPSADNTCYLSDHIREELDITAVAIHALKFATISRRGETPVTIQGPYTPHPKISTGGGDHFNAGLAHGILIGANQIEQLIIATATSGLYVRTGLSPNCKELINFIETQS